MPCWASTAFRKGRASRSCGSRTANGSWYPGRSGTCTVSGGCRRAHGAGTRPRERQRQRGQRGNHEIACSGGGDRRRGGRMQRALPPDAARLERRDAHRACRAHPRLDVARRRGLPHPQRRHQHGRAPGLHHPALPRARGAHRPVLRAPSRGRAHPRLGPGPPRLPQGRARQAPLHGARDRDRRAGGGRAALSHHEPRGTSRSALRSPRRAPRPRRHHPGVRPGGTHAGGGDRAPQPVARAPPAPRRKLGRGDRERHRQRRVRRQRGGALGAGGRRDGRRLPALPPDGAPVPRDRRPPRGLRARHRASALHGPGRRELPPPGGPRPRHRHVRAAVRAVGGGGDPGGLRAGAPPREDRPHRGQARHRVRALPGAADGRGEAHHQRPVHLRAGREPPRRPGARAPELLGGVRGDGGVQPGRWGRARARGVDDRGGALARHLRDGRRPLRRLVHPALHASEGARELPAPVRGLLPERGSCRPRAGW